MQVKGKHDFNNEPTLGTEEEILQAITDLEGDLDHDIMMKWTLALDFDEYCNNWIGLSTTGKSDGTNFSHTYIYTIIVTNTCSSGFIHR